MRYIITSYQASMSYDEERESWVTGLDVPDNAFVTVENFYPGYSPADADAGTITVNVIIPVTDTEEGDGKAVEAPGPEA